MFGRSSGRRANVGKDVIHEKKNIKGLENKFNDLRGKFRERDKKTNKQKNTDERRGNHLKKYQCLKKNAQTCK